MTTAAALDQFLDPLGRCLDAESARRIVALRVAPSLQEKVDALAERASQGLLNDQERSEYEAIVDAADFVSILQAKARRQFSNL